MASLSKQERAQLLSELTDDDIAELEHDWGFWSRPNQRAPVGNWSVWVILAGRGFGKALALATPVATPTGWSTMGDLSDGDTVFDETGSTCRVLKAHPVLIGRDCYRVRFSDGAEIIADGDHLWTTHDRRYRKAIKRRVLGANSSKPQCQIRFSPQTLTTREIARGELLRSVLWHRVRSFMATRDLLVLPTVGVQPFPVEQPYPTEINGKPLEHYTQWFNLTYGITLTGLPAISVPCGFTRSGLPVGLQIVGRRHHEDSVLRAAAAFEAAAPWADRIPPVVAALAA